MHFRIARCGIFLSFGFGRGLALWSFYYYFIFLFYYFSCYVLQCSRPSTFISVFLANCMLSPVRLSVVCCLFLTFVRPT